MKTQLKLDGTVVDNMKFDGCHRLSVFTNQLIQLIHILSALMHLKQCCVTCVVY